MKREIRVHVLGGGHEVGRNCFVLTYPTGEKIMLDCGANAVDNDIDLAFVSHPHLDHIRALPIACKYGLKSPIIVADEIAKQVSRVILEDSFKIESRHSGGADYEYSWIKYAISCMRIERIGTIGNVRYELIPNSHIPGAVSIFLKHALTKSVLYTGDLKMSESRLMSARTFMPQSEVVFMEGIYGNVLHPERKKTELELKETVLKTLKHGGQVLIPCFSVARTQEVLLLLDAFRNEIDVPIYLDGMGRSITQIYLENAEKIDNQKLVKAARNVEFVQTDLERINSLNRQAIYVVSGGMVNSPLSHFYLENIAYSRHNSLILTGFQAENTSGFELINAGTITLNKGEIGERKIKPRCRVIHLSLSSHADCQEKQSLIKLVAPEMVIGIHGEEDGLAGLGIICDRLGVGYIAPRNGDIIRI